MDRILLAPEPLVRAVLVALCDNQRLQARSLRYLDRLEKPPGAPTSTGNTKYDSPTNIHQQFTGTDPLGRLGKRKSPDPPPPQICIQCKHAFLPHSNNPQACAFHHGNMNIDPSHGVWAGQDSQQPHIDFNNNNNSSNKTSKNSNDTDDNREDRPEGFTWSCCGRGGARPGCTEGEHLAVRADDRSKRRRVDPAADPDSLRVFEGKVLRPNEFVNNRLMEDDSSDESSGDEELVWGAAAVPRGAASPDGDVPSEGTERDSGGSDV
ncbi:hypothetical protein Daus18300_008567 [Diaporthe australafricana]|uniref:C2H2-type domain-containing protein n=1 Tax=Diaporthe australafricana TaxID=127596 RepID=A0ABR3WIG0_9PEZI